jgi:hypothetical protein
MRRERSWGDREIRRDDGDDDVERDRDQEIERESQPNRAIRQ